MIEVSRPSAWKSVGLVTLIACSVWAAHLVTVRGVRLTGDRLLGVAAVAVLVVLLVRKGLRWTPVHWALATFVGVQVATSLLAASVWPRGPRLATVYVLGFACFALAADWAAERSRLRHGVLAWITLGAVLGLAGAAATVLSNLWDARVWGVGLHPDRGPVKTFSARGTFNERNLYSSFLLVAFALALWAWRPDPGRRARFWAGYLPVAGTVLGLVFGLTRAAWVGMAGIAAFWLWARRPSLPQGGALVLVVLLGFTLQWQVMGASPLQFRVLDPLLQGRDHNLAVRLRINRSTTTSWLTRPVLGNGAGSVNRLRVRGSGRQPWNGNLVLFVLHDSGLVGVAALAGVLVVVAGTARKAPARAEDDAPVVPLLAAGVALLWAYQFTHGLWLMYPYVYLGLLTAAITEGRRRA